MMTENFNTNLMSTLYNPSAMLRMYVISDKVDKRQEYWEAWNTAWGNICTSERLASSQSGFITPVRTLLGMACVPLVVSKERFATEPGK